MNCDQLLEILQKMKEDGEDMSKEIVIPVYGNSIGGTSFSKISAVGKSFDQEQDKVLIYTSSVLKRVSEDLE